MSTKSGSLSIVCVQLRQRKQESIKANGRAVGTFRTVSYIMGVRYSGVYVKRYIYIYLVVYYIHLCYLWDTRNNITLTVAVCIASFKTIGKLQRARLPSVTTCSNLLHYFKVCHRVSTRHLALWKITSPIWRLFAPNLLHHVHLKREASEVRNFKTTVV